MECLHGEPASSSRTTNGIFFYCGQKPSCNFFCPQNDCSFFQNPIAMWRNSNSPQPRCHEHKKLAKMRVVKDIFKLSFGRPCFVCSDKEKPCSFWQWGDVIRPQCYHGMQCSTRKVKKEGANKGRLFYACSKGKDQSCGYFEWRDTERKEEDDDLLNRFTQCILVCHHRLGIRSRKPVKRLEVITKITNKFTQNICRLKIKRNVTHLKTSKTSYAN